MPETMQTKLFNVIAKSSGVQPENISLESELEDFGIDSVGIAELMFDLEEEFSIEFVDEADITKRLISLRTVQDIVNIVDTLVLEKDEI